METTSKLATAALLHEIQGRSTSISLLCSHLRHSLQDQGLGWLESRLARIEITASEMQRICQAIAMLDDNSEPDRTVIDVGALSVRIIESLQACEPSAWRLNVRIQSNIRIFGHEQEIELLLRNLIGNALKFSAHRERPELRITATEELGKTTVQISDDGVGIAPEDASRMFELFARCHPRFSGSGVGLAIARRIVERHHGRIWATGEVGVGTTFSFSL
jgi:signal transduction histidine kinase